jgi:hypothetical protein
VAGDFQEVVKAMPIKPVAPGAEIAIQEVMERFTVEFSRNQPKIEKVRCVEPPCN